MAQTNKPIRPSPVFGTLFGLIVGGLYSMVAVLLVVTRGMKFFEENGLPLGQLLITYLGGFALGGPTVRCLLPLALAGRWGHPRRARDSTNCHGRHAHARGPNQDLVRGDRSIDGYLRDSYWWTCWSDKLAVDDRAVRP
jgi:hypothetical protein